MQEEPEIFQVARPSYFPKFHTHSFSPHFFIFLSYAFIFPSYFLYFLHTLLHICYIFLHISFIFFSYCFMKFFSEKCPTGWLPFLGGIPTGSPLSLFISEIFMNKSKSEHHRLLSHVIYWHRYVDDVWYQWNGSAKQESEFLQFLNSCYHSIKLTVEVESLKINDFRPHYFHRQ